MQTDILLSLCDPKIPIDSSIELARDLMRSGRLLDVELAKLLPDRNGENGRELTQASAIRILEILDRISVGTRIVTIICGLANHPDSKLRSKAAAIIGRRVNNPAWISKHLFDADPRVRANVVESLWLAASSHSESVFLKCMNDSDNRVAGNAVYGLYLQGHREAIPAIQAFATHCDPRFRMTAAWLIAQTDDANLLATLATLLTDQELKVRHAAFKSLARIKTRHKPDRAGNVPSPAPAPARVHPESTSFRI